MQFNPSERYVTGLELLSILASELDQHSRIYLAAKMKNRSLMDLHPIKGGIDTGLPDDCGLPALETGLFSVTELQVISQTDGWKFKVPLRMEAVLLRKENSAKRRTRLHEWFKEEVEKNGQRGALTRTAKREGITPQTLSSILKR